jgi:hypothetical protein
MRRPEKDLHIEISLRIAAERKVRLGQASSDTVKTVA